MKKQRKASSHRLTRRQAIVALGLGGAGAAVAWTLWGGQRADSTASTLDVSARFASFEPADAPNGDLSKVVWPPFVTRANPEVKRLYEFNIQNGELMRYMPCFCGCHLEDGHRNNRDCYVEEVKADGSVVLDSMAPT